MSDLRLSLAISDYVHTADVANGRLRPAGIDFTVVNLPFEAVTMRFGANLEFDVAEFSLANYCAALAGLRPAPMIALPISPRVHFASDLREQASRPFTSFMI
jgi:4,5-dihydroxyphthalate decarboxylase